MTQLQIYLLGDLRLFIGERPLPFKTLPKSKSLLAYCLLHRDVVISRSKLAFTLWPDASEKQAKSRLRRHLYDLRQALPPAPDELPWLLVTAQTVQWNPAAAYWLDTAAFNHAGQNGRLAEAAALYTGPLAPELDEPWLILERQSLHTQYVQTLARLVAAQWQAGDWPQAIIYAQQALAEDGFNEAVLRHYLALLHAQGDRTTAVSHYLQFRQQLKEELDVEPLPQTTAVYAAIQDNQTAEQIFALADLKAEPKAAPAAVPVRQTPGTVPAPLRPLVGRTAEQAALVKLLTGFPSVRLLTLTGIGGIGKTQLAIAVAAHLQTHCAAQFADGCYFVPLASLTTSVQVWTAAADQLGIKTSGQSSPFAQLQEQLRYKQCLLVLDNFEHLLAATPQLNALLHAAPQLQVLVTSITPLGLAGEQEYPLPPMPLPTGETETIDELAQNEAVALFTAVAQAANPHFQLTEQNAAAVVQICRYLDGIPLAIELAAARSKHLAPAQLRQQLITSQQILSDAAPNRPTRHQSLTAALHWSYSLLSVEEKELLHQLAQFPGGFSLAAVSHICFQQPEPTIDAFDPNLFQQLTQLADKHFIYATTAPCAEGVLRFEMLRTVRTFLLAQAASSSTEWRLRYVNYYMAIIWPLLTEWHGAVAKWQLWLNNEQENVRQALVWAAAAEDETRFGPSGCQIVAGLVSYWQMNAHLDEAVARIEQFEPKLSTCSIRVQIRFLRAAGAINDVVGVPDATAFAYRERALQLANQLEDQELICLCLDSFGSSANRRGAFDQAEPLLREALTLETTLNQGKMRYRQASIMMNLSIAIKNNSGDPEQVKALQEGCVSFLRTAERPADLAKALLSLCHTYRNTGDHPADAACLREGLAIGQRLNDRFVQILFLTAVADHAEFHQNLTTCVQLYGAFLTLSNKFSIGWPPYYKDGFAKQLETLRARLAPNAYALAWEKGARLSLSEAVALAHQTILG